MIPELVELQRRLSRWVEIEFEQRWNLMLLGVRNPGGKGRQQYSINHPLFPED